MLSQLCIDSKKNILWRKRLSKGLAAPSFNFASIFTVPDYLHAPAIVKFSNYVESYFHVSFKNYYAPFDVHKVFFSKARHWTYFFFWSPYPPGHNLNPTENLQRIKLISFDGHIFVLFRVRPQFCSCKSEPWNFLNCWYPPYQCAVVWHLFFLRRKKGFTYCEF